MFVLSQKNMVTLGLHDLHKPEYHAISYPKNFCAYYKSDDKKAYTWTGLIRIHYANMGIEPQTTSNWNVKVGDTNTRTFIFHNTGDADLYNINLSSVPNEYKIVENGCTGTVKIGGKCEFKIAFTPTKASKISGKLDFSATAQEGYMVNLLSSNKDCVVLQIFYLHFSCYYSITKSIARFLKSLL